MGKNQFEYKMCIVLRMDLGMSTGKLIAQAAHAAVGVSELSKKENHKNWRKWRDEGGKKVALQVESLDELKDLQKMANDLDITNVMIQDAGQTEVPEGTITALGLGPERAVLMDRVTGLLPLIK